jgi:tetratricopeptide (TPR) repeat protein
VTILRDEVDAARGAQGHGPPHPFLPTLLITLATAMTDVGQATEALDVGREAIALAEALLVPGARDQQNVLFNFGQVLILTGHYEEARRLYRGVLEVDRQKLSPDHPDHANTLGQLAVLDLVTDRYDEAIRRAEAARAVYDSVFGPESEEALEQRLVVALAILHAGQADAAEQALREALAIAGASAEAQHRLRWALGHVLLQRGRHAEAEAPLEAARPHVQVTPLFQDMLAGRPVAER